MARMISLNPLIISGKLGDKVYYMRNGKSYVRKLPAPRKNKNEIPWGPQQLKFSLVMKFLQPLIPLFNVSFKSAIWTMSKFNKAFSHSIQHAVKGEYPSFGIDYKRVLLGDGLLHAPWSMAVCSPKAGELAFIWNVYRNSSISRAEDNVYIAVYCESLNKWWFNEYAAARRDGTYTIHLPKFAGKSVQAYSGFISVCGKHASKSHYMGCIEIN